MSNPDLLMCDELSLGLAPVIVRDIYAALPGIVADGMSAIIVEPDVRLGRQISLRRRLVFPSEATARTDDGRPAEGVGVIGGAQALK